MGWDGVEDLGESVNSELTHKNATDRRRLEIKATKQAAGTLYHAGDYDTVGLY